jgi:hypothetical protein
MSDDEVGEVMVGPPPKPTSASVDMAWWGVHICPQMSTRHREINLGQVIAYPNIVGNLHL